MTTQATTTIDTPYPDRADSRHWFIGWITMENHKKIGLSYMTTGLFFFLLAGLLALAMRLQLARPNNGILGNDAYNQAFTMHGTTMISGGHAARGHGQLSRPAHDRRAAT
ncbi:MAG: cbb3-type cytochrome c oxidase subunit I [Caldilineaceae bacterium]